MITILIRMTLIKIKPIKRNKITISVWANNKVNGIWAKNNMNFSMEKRLSPNKARNKSK